MEEALFGDSSEVGEEADDARRGDLTTRSTATRSPSSGSTRTTRSSPPSTRRTSWTRRTRWTRRTSWTRRTRWMRSCPSRPAPRARNPKRGSKTRRRGSPSWSAPPRGEDRPPVHTEFASDTVPLDADRTDEGEAAVDDGDGAAWPEPEPEPDACDVGAGGGRRPSVGVSAMGRRHRRVPTKPTGAQNPIVIPADLSELDEFVAAYSRTGRRRGSRDPRLRPAPAGAAPPQRAGADVRRFAPVGLPLLRRRHRRGGPALRAHPLERSAIRDDSAAGGGGGGRAGSGASSPANVARLESAITDVQSASSGAQAGLTTLTVFPTPPRVATIINPYVDSLQLYETLASSVTVPRRPAAPRARPTRRCTRTSASSGPSTGCPPFSLAPSLTGSSPSSTQLQSTMDALQHALNTATP